MKALTKILALALAAGSAFSFAACSGSSTSKTATNAYWNERVISNDDLTTSVWLQNKEIATYKITFEKGSSGTYSVDYVTDGSKTAEYKTEFYATEYDWNDSSVPTDYRLEKKEYVYVYKTTMTISGAFSMTSSDESKSFDDSIERVSYFRSTSDNLQPIYSKQVIKSTAPANLSASTIADAYVQVDATYETFYNAECTQATIKTQDNLTPSNDGEKTIDLGAKYSVFDVSSLEVAMRAFTKTSGSTYLFNTLIPVNSAEVAYYATVSATAALNSEDETEKSIIDALDNSSPSSYIFVGTDSEGKKTYNYNPVTLTLNSSLTGPSSVYYYATVANNSFNSARSVLLKVSSPLYYGLGTLTYSLSSLEFKSLSEPSAIPEDDLL